MERPSSLRNMFNVDPSSQINHCFCTDQTVSGIVLLCSAPLHARIDVCLHLFAPYCSYLADEPSELITARYAYIYCTYTVIVKPQVRRQPVDNHTFPRMVDERRRFIEAHSHPIAAALRTVRLHGWRSDRSLATLWTSNEERGREHMKRPFPS